MKETVYNWLFVRAILERWSSNVGLDVSSHNLYWKAKDRIFKRKPNIRNVNNGIC